MKIAVRYYSKTGNTQKLADAIGKALDVPSMDVSVPLREEVDILFLGSSVYGAGVDREVKRFIKTLPGKAKTVVNFSTAAILPSTYNQVKKLLEKQNVTMAQDEFHCRGSFQMLHKGKPDADDLRAVAQFAKGIVGG